LEVRTLKNKIVSGIFLALLGGLIAIAPNLLISQHCLNMQMKCFCIAKMELGIGILIIVLALLFICFESRETKLGISLSLVLIGVFSALIATVLIGFCNGTCSTDCSCNPATSLIIAILGTLVALISFMNFMTLNHRKLAG
jgi:hypothetical protein